MSKLRKKKRKPLSQCGLHFLMKKKSLAREVKQMIVHILKWHLGVKRVTTMLKQMCQCVFQVSSATSPRKKTQMKVSRVMGKFLEALRLATAKPGFLLSMILTLMF